MMKPAQSTAHSGHANNVGLTTLLGNAAHRRNRTGDICPACRRQPPGAQKAQRRVRCARRGQTRLVVVLQVQVPSQIRCPPAVGSCWPRRGAPADGSPPAPRPHKPADLVRSPRDMPRPARALPWRLPPLECKKLRRTDAASRACLFKGQGKASSGGLHAMYALHGM